MPDTRDIRAYLGSLVAAAVSSAVAAGELPDLPVPGDTIERPKDAANGDFASALPLRLARAAMKTPIEIAGTIARHMPADSAVDPPVVAPPGFLNFRLSQQFVQQQVEHLAQSPDRVRLRQPDRAAPRRERSRRRDRRHARIRALSRRLRGRA
jgi:arginyl-tRNA synthetase